MSQPARHPLEAPTGRERQQLLANRIFEGCAALLATSPPAEPPPHRHNASNNQSALAAAIIGRRRLRRRSIETHQATASAAAGVGSIVRDRRKHAMAVSVERRDWWRWGRQNGRWRRSVMLDARPKCAAGVDHRLPRWAQRAATRAGVAEAWPRPVAREQGLGRLQASARRLRIS